MTDFIQPEALGDALWKWHLVIKDWAPELRILRDGVDSPEDLLLCQWVQLMAAVLEFQPDLILEIGRGYGNSTCAFTEAANRLGGKTRVLSIDSGNAWDRTARRLVGIVPPGWLDRLSVLVCDARDADYVKSLAGAERIFVFWDGHGYDTAEIVLGKVLPELQSVKHLVAIHDIYDVRYLPRDFQVGYGQSGVWRGTPGNWTTSLIIDDVYSFVPEAVSLLDFTTRNKLSLFSADHSLNLYFEQHPDCLAELQQQLSTDLLTFDGGEMFIAGWRWFSLNQGSPPFTFPQQTSHPIEESGRWLKKAKAAYHILVTR